MRPAHAVAYQGGAALEEVHGFAAAIVDQHAFAAQTGDPDGRGSVQVPRPAGVGHDVHQLRLAGRAPQAPQVGRQPQRRAQSAHVRQPRWPHGQVDLDQIDLGAGLAQQPGQLRGLVGDAARRRRQRPDQRDPQAGDGRGAHAGRQRVRAVHTTCARRR